jgi:hypothetical protein
MLALDRHAAHPVEHRLQLAAVEAERALPKLAGEIEARRIDVVH